MPEETKDTDTAVEGSLSLSPEGHIVRFCCDLESILGHGAGDVIGKPFSELSPPGYEEEHAELFEAVKGLDSSAELRTMLRHKDDTHVDVFVSVHPLVDPIGSVYSYILTLGTSSPPTTPAILSNEFQRMFKSSNDGVVFTDKSGNIIDVNQAFLDCYGYTRKELLGNNPRIMKSEHSTPELYEKMWRDILDPSRGFWRGELLNTAKDGSLVPVLLSINAIKDAAGRVKSFLGIVMNLSKQKEMDRLNRMYIDHIVHDMRSPLTSIMANSEMLLMQLDPDAPDEVRHKLEVTVNCARKLSSMTSDILDYSRAQSGSLTVRKTNIKLNRLVNDALLPFRSSKKKLLVNGLDFSERQLNGMEVEADPDKLERVIYNLLSNAFKHATSEVRLSVEPRGDWLKFTVTDDGKGFSVAEAESIFEPFYQAEEGIRTGGAGLGLNIVKSFVEALGGKVWVDTDSSKGATFCVLIPRSANMASNGA